MSKNEEKISRLKETENLVIVLRNQPVLIDRDVASLYSVTTKEINQAVRNNPEKFPEGYIFPLQVVETQELVKNFDRFQPIKHSVIEPKAFTEKGLYMLATILKSPIATEVTIAIIETFTKVREVARMMQSISENDGEVSKNTLRVVENKMKDVFTDNMPLKMKRAAFSVNIGILKISIETTWEKPDEKIKNG